jgi:oligopeptide transport system substrate-binding protein
MNDRAIRGVGGWSWIVLALMLAGWCCAAHGATPGDAARGGSALKVARLPMRTDGPKSLDPAKGSTQYDNMACSQVYDQLLQYKYLARPLDVEPLLAAEMPRITDNPDGTQTWRFRLREDVYFHDDPCFAGGKGRRLRAEDVFYSWKRLADPRYELENWWLIEGMIVGFDAYKTAQGIAAKFKPGQETEFEKARVEAIMAAEEQGRAELEAAFALAKIGRFEYDAAVRGLKVIDDLNLEILLTGPVQQFRWKLTQFQLSVVPREAVEKYGEQFGAHPVGTGAFIVKDGDWQQGRFLNYTRNPNFREERYPSEMSSVPEIAARDRGFGLDQAAGKRLPFLDRIECPFYVPDPPMWLDFESGKLDYVQMPAEYFDKAVNRRTLKLRPEYARKGVTLYPEPLLDFIFRGFNMHDPVVGGYSEKQRKLRQAISLAMDLDETNESFYNGTNSVYDGPIPPGLDGYPKDGHAPVSYRGPDLARARRLLAEAGYPDGKGLPEIVYYSSRGGNQAEQTQAEIQMCRAIGVKLNPRLVDFSEMIEAINKNVAMMFGYAWGSDYPDAESNLAMFYSKNKSPGSNSFNYDRPDYDRMYERSRTMPPGPERTALYEQMRDMIIEDCPFVGSLGRTRFYAINARLKNFKPSEDCQNWYKYLDVRSEE